MRSGTVSIHARVRRATRIPAASTPRDLFQSTPAYGGRRKTDVGSRTRGVFQSTPAYGGRRHRTRYIPRCQSFNPRPRTAGDRSCAFLHRPNTCFNPRPRTAGDIGGSGARGDRHVSIHARVRRATRFERHLRLACSSFNPRPRTAGDRPGVSPRCNQSVSIHARVRRATGRRNDALRCFGFQSTPAYGGRPLHCNSIDNQQLWGVIRERGRIRDQEGGPQPGASHNSLKRYGLAQSRTSRKSMRASGSRRPVHALSWLRKHQNLPGYTTSGPSRSTDSFAPTCSTRRFQLLPRK